MKQLMRDSGPRPVDRSRDVPIAGELTETRPTSGRRLNRFARGVVLVALVAASTAIARADEGTDVVMAAAWDDYLRGNFLGAAENLEDLLRDEPDLDAARILLLRVCLEMGDVERAEEIDTALAARPEDAVTLPMVLARADYAFARGRVMASQELAQRAIALAPENLHAHYQVARAQRERGDRAAARATVGAAVRLHPPRSLDADGLLDLARLYREGGTSDDLELAAQCCVYAEQKRKKEGRATTDVLVLLGDLYFEAKSMSGDTPRAFKTYRDALAQNASLVAAKVGRAWTHLYVYDSYDAEKEIDEALAVNPRSVDALTVKAWLRVMDARHSEALELIDEALAVNPSAKKARAVRAAALYMIHHTEEFEAEVAEVLRLDPTYGELFWTIGDALSHLMRYRDAVTFHERAVATDPELPLGLVSLGRDLAYVGREGEAREALEKSLQTHPFRHPWRHNMLLLMKKFDAEFVDHESEHFHYRVHVDENQVLGDRLESAHEDDLVYLSERYGYRPDGKTLIEMFDDHRDFSVRSIGWTGLGAVGACFGSLVTLVSPRSEMRHGFVWRRTALHELAHVMTIGRSKGRVPRWLTEGLSVFEERCVNPTWGRDQELELLHAYYNDDVIPLETFNAAFRGPRIGFAYYQGGRWCEFVAARYGFDKILEMLDAYAQDLETEDVIERVFGKTCGDTDQEFLSYIHETYLKDVRVQPLFSDDKRREMRARLRREPEDPDLLANVAWAYYQSGKEVDSDVYLDKALRAAPDHPVARRLAAQRAVDRRRPDMAEEHLRVAFANGGEEYYAALLLARIRSKKSDFAGAREALNTAAECFPFAVEPGNPDLQLRELLAGEGDMQGAVEALKRHVDRLENDFSGRLELATWYFAQGQFADAYRYAREAEDIDPFVRTIYVTQGKAKRELGEPVEALAALRSALLVDRRLEPGYSPAPDEQSESAAEEEDRIERAEILVTIAEIERAMGDRDSARRDVQQALRLAPDLESALDLEEALDSDS